MPAAYALARFPIPCKEVIFVVLLLALIVPYQALLTPMFLMFAKLGLTNSLLGLAVAAHRDPAAVQPVHPAQQLRAPSRGSSRRRPSMDGASSIQALRRVFLPSTVPAIVTVALFAFIMSWNEFLGALVMMSKSRPSPCR